MTRHFANMVVWPRGLLLAVVHMVAVLSLTAIAFVPALQDSSLRSLSVTRLYGHVPRRHFIYYSPNFHRYVICEQIDCEDNQGTADCIVRTLESVSWLDEAQSKYPNATLLPLMVSRIPTGMPHVAGGGPDGDELLYGSASGSSSCNRTESNTIGMSMDDSDESAAKIVYSDQRLSRACTTETLRKYDAVVARLDQRLGSSLYERFSPSDRHWIRERILFLLSPLPKKNEEEEKINSGRDEDLLSSMLSSSSSFLRMNDWPLVFWEEGYGAGLTERQAFLAILSLRHLLEMNPLEAVSRKPPLSFFYRHLKVEFESIEEVRNDLDQWLVGTVGEDAATFAYLRSLNVTIPQCEVLLSVFGLSLLSCDLDPSWEFHASEGPLRRNLDPNALHFLRMRLQVGPADISGMIKSQPRVSTYSLHTLVSHVDAMQNAFGLSSADVRQLCMSSPSILGISTSKFNERAAFLQQDLQMDLPMICQSVMKSPGLLSCSVEGNLRPKLDYLKAELLTSEADLTSLLVSNTRILTGSFKNKLRPTVDGLLGLGLSREEMRDVVLSVPQLLTMTWQTSLQPKLWLLQARLGYAESDLRLLVTKMPRVLLHGMASTTAKLDLLEKASNASTAKVAYVVLENPSLLLATKASLQRRVEAFLDSNETFEIFFNPRQSGQREGAKPVLRRRKKTIIEVNNSTGVVNRVFPNIETAADAIGASQGNMYSILNLGRVYKGMNYLYGCLEANIDSSAPPTASESTKIMSVRVTSIALRRNTLVNILSIDKKGDHDTDGGTYHLTILTSARSFSLRKSSSITALDKAGGMALYFPQFQGTRIERILKIVKSYLGQKILTSFDDMQHSQSDGLVLLEYKYLRPSRNRASLYLCFEVLRIVARLFSLEAANRDTAFCNSKLVVDVYTDSVYAWQSLHNENTLLQWGSCRTKDEFMKSRDEDGTKKRISDADILYPLARIYSSLRRQTIFSTYTKQTGHRFASSIQIRFRHQSEWNWAVSKDPIVPLLGNYADQAAKRQFEDNQALSRNERMWRDSARQDLFYF